MPNIAVRIMVIFGVSLLASPMLALSAGPAEASAPETAYVCSGTPASPGTLAAGTYSTVTIRGLCQVNAGQVVVTGNVAVTPGSVLAAAFAHNDRTHSGTSGLTAGNILVGSGATLVLGCEAAHFACLDDPNQKSPTLVSHDTVTGSISAYHPLGIVVHVTKIGGSVSQVGGGGGESCVPQGAFTKFMVPVYSDYEDDTIGGSIQIVGLGSCWLGALRDTVGGNFDVLDNHMGDPDAMEVNSNKVGGNLTCAGNSPAVQFGDGHGTPNLVIGNAYGECGFGVLAPEPAPAPAMPAAHGAPAKPATPAGPLMHISVRQ